MKRDPGFRQGPSGLLVPESLERERQLWTRDEWRLLERATKMLKSHGLTLQLQCDRPSCHVRPIEGSRLPDGGFRLRCDHADRVMQKHF